MHIRKLYDEIQSWEGKEFLEILKSSCAYYAKTLENTIRNKKVELAVSSVVFLYAANIVWYFLTGVFEWGDPLGVYLIFIANGILGLILYVAVSLICYRKIKISPKNNRVLRICLIIITGIFFVWLVLFRLLPNFE